MCAVCCVQCNSIRRYTHRHTNIPIFNAEQLFFSCLFCVVSALLLVAFILHAFVELSAATTKLRTFSSLWCLSIHFWSNEQSIQVSRDECSRFFVCRFSAFVHRTISYKLKTQITAIIYPKINTKGKIDIQDKYCTRTKYKIFQMLLKRMSKR